MQKKINCNQIQDKICGSENIFDVKNFNKIEKSHFNSCPKCQEYLKEIQSIISSYRKYDVKMSSEMKKKSLKEVCHKIKNK